MEKINLYDAIAAMRKDTENNVPFSVMFMSCDTGKKISNGVTVIDKAKLRPQDTKEKNIMADYMLNLVNLATNDYRRCYQPLLMMYNGKKVELA